MEKTDVKSLKKLIKAHETRLKNIQKADLKDLCNPTDYLVNYLRYTRDFLIMVGWDTINERHEMSMLALVTAIEEYEKYLEADALLLQNTVQYIKEGNYADKVAEHKKQKQKHWSKFWKLLELNIEDWYQAYVDV